MAQPYHGRATTCTPWINGDERVRPPPTHEEEPRRPERQPPQRSSPGRARHAAGLGRSVVWRFGRGLGLGLSEQLSGQPSGAAGKIAEDRLVAAGLAADTTPTTRPSLKREARGPPLALRLYLRFGGGTNWPEISAAGPGL